MGIGNFLNYSLKENAATLVSSVLGITLSAARDGLFFENSRWIFYETASAKYEVNITDKTVTPIE